MKHFKFIPTLLLAVTILLVTSCKKEETQEITIERGTVTDIDGNTYQTVKIGDQWWMAENLRVSRFNDGTPLLLIGLTDPDSVWANAGEAAYTYINDSIFGNLYNGEVITSEKNIAPAGWHVPSDAEWQKMERTIGMDEADIAGAGWRGMNEGEKITSKYSQGWPEGGELFGTDEYGFNALPGGCRLHDGRTNIFNNTSFWWTNDFTEDEGWYRYIDKNDKRIFRQHTYRQYGMSIRCIKD